MRSMKRLSSLLFIIIILAFRTSWSQAQTDWHYPPAHHLIHALKIRGPLHFCGEPVPLKEDDVLERLERELLIYLDNADDVILWLKRANRYFPHIEKRLKDNDMPDDLKYIVITESHLRPTATSHKDAVGFWQFIEKTALRYGLKTNKDIDERRNFFAASEAAIAYLKDLYRIFDSWTLAAAAYNMGEEGLKTEMLMQKVNTYYRLYLNQETHRYVFKILAAKMILSNPQKYGFNLNNEDLYKPFQFDRVEIIASQPVPLYIIAHAASSYFKIIKELNPHIRGYYLPAGKHEVLIPKGSAKDFKQRYENLLNDWIAGKGKYVYTVQKGDNLSGIAKQFNVSVKAIMNWNGLTSARNVSPGEKLFIFTDDPE